MRVVFFGDSIAAGCRAAVGEGWVERLASLLPELDVRNAGVNGETTQDALRRFDQSVAAVQPDTVYVQFGLNDASWWCRQVGRSWVQEADYIANMREIVRRCRECGVKTVLVATNHPVLDAAPASAGTPAEADTPTYSGTVRQYNAALRAAFADGPEVLVDMEAVFDAEGDLPSLLDADGLHLSPQGNILYAATVEGFFRKNFAFLVPSPFPPSS